MCDRERDRVLVEDKRDWAGEGYMGRGKGEWNVGEREWNEGGSEETEKVQEEDLRESLDQNEVDSNH